MTERKSTDGGTAATETYRLMASIKGEDTKTLATVPTYADCFQRALGALATLLAIGVDLKYVSPTRNEGRAMGIWDGWSDARGFESTTMWIERVK